MSQTLLLLNIHHWSCFLEHDLCVLTCGWGEGAHAPECGCIWTSENTHSVLLRHQVETGPLTLLEGRRRLCWLSSEQRGGWFWGSPWFCIPDASITGPKHLLKSFFKPRFWGLNPCPCSQREQLPQSNTDFSKELKLLYHFSLWLLTVLLVNTLIE